MIIKNFSYSNDKIELNNVSLDFSDYGIYLITGGNGTGKSSFLREVLFKSNAISFCDPTQQDMFLQEPARVVAFMPQDMYVSDCSVETYITKECGKCQKDLLEELLELFHLQYINRKSKIKKLSGGEQTKLSIISAVIKDTPYLILDEPTNHLDDAGVEQFITILDRLKQKKTIIMVSHDPRILEVYKGSVIFGQNTVTQLSECTGTKNTSSVNKEVIFQLRKYISRASNKLLTFLVHLIFYSVFIFLTFYNTLLFQDGYASKDNYRYDKIVHTYKAEYTFGEGNRRYTKENKITVSKDKYDRCIYNRDIHSLLDNKLVKRVIAFDEQLFWQIAKEDTILSMPEFFYADYYDMYIADNAWEGTIVEGTYPEDGGDQVLLPDTYKSSYHLGDEMKLGNETFHVSGFTNGEYIIKSYEPNAYFMEITPDTVDKYIEKYGADESYNSFFLVSQTSDKELLTQLIQEFPAENYVSKSFSDAWYISYNRDFIVKDILPLNLIVSLLFSIIICFVKRYKIKYDRNMIYDCSVYFFQVRKVKRTYKAFQILQTFAFVFLLIVINHIFSDMARPVNSVLLLDALIIYIPGIFMVNRMVDRSNLYG